MMTLLLCMSLMVVCVASRKAFACTYGLLEDGCAHVADMPLEQAAEGSCGGETQLWVSVPRSDAALDGVSVCDGAPVGGEVPLESEAAEVRESATLRPDEQLRRSVTVPASQGQALPLTSDTRPTKATLCTLVLGGSLALISGLRLKKEVER